MDATPFASSTKKKDEKSEESTSLIDELGPLLTSKGFHYHGSEVLHSGFLGTELECEIFIGPVYYQRLRHMVSDKFQVRRHVLFLIFYSTKTIINNLQILTLSPVLLLIHHIKMLN